jgi:hypothetical protein
MLSNILLKKIKNMQPTLKPITKKLETFQTLRIMLKTTKKYSNKPLTLSVSMHLPKM